LALITVASSVVKKPAKTGSWGAGADAVCAVYCQREAFQGQSNGGKGEKTTCRTVMAEIMASMDDIPTIGSDSTKN
jgi:hypothetical protein